MPTLDEHLIASTTAGPGLFGGHLGPRPGLRRPPAAPGPARAARIRPRSAPEWIEQQAVAGNRAVDDMDREADGRRHQWGHARSGTAGTVDVDAGVVHGLRRAG